MKKSIKYQPLVSICIPTYNGMAFLENTLSSALAQTYGNIEILVCDDASADGTVSFIRQLGDNRIRLLKNTHNTGMVANWNRCLQEAQGEWIKILFQDDILSSDCVQNMLEACLSHHAVAALCSRDFIITNNVQPCIKRFFSREIIKPLSLFGRNTTFISPSYLALQVKRYLLQNVLGEPSCYFIKKDILDEVGLFKTAMNQLVDYEFILRVGAAKGFVFLPQTLAYFRVHERSQTTANVTMEKVSVERSIGISVGDSMILLKEYLCNPHFLPIREQIGEEVLQDYIRHIYHSGCKHHGEKRMNKALSHIREQYKELAFRYNFFKYIYYRYKIKKCESLLKS